jgi:prepilin-type N-terminal cleavage/methylation domain-containing protein
MKSINCQKFKVKYQQGFSLVEMLVVIFIFSILAIITTQAIATSLRSSQKSESIGKVRENVDFSISTMERLLRNAQNATCSGSSMTYVDGNNQPGSFSCMGSPAYIASGSANVRITGTDIVVNCAETSFVCPPPSGAPQSITITVSATTAGVTGPEAASVKSSTKMLLRTY